MPSNKNIGIRVPVVASAGYPFDRPAQIRPGVRYAQANFPGAGRFSVPSPTDRAARGGQIQNYDSMGRVADTKYGKNWKGGR